MKTKANKGRIWVGTSGWSYPEWNKKFYPAQLPKKDWFHFYIQHFNTVELNATFYRSFQPATYRKWYRDAPDNFLYAIKGSRYITHRKYLKDVKKSVQLCEHSAHSLKEKLGVILLQMPRNLPYDLDRLETALKVFRHPDQVAVEFRHKKWITLETKQLLEKLGVIFCDVDSPELSLQNWVTADTGYIRLHGSRTWYRSNYSKEKLNNIAFQAKKMLKKGAKQVFVFFNNDFNANAVKNALTLKEILRGKKKEG